MSALRCEFCEGFSPGPIPTAASSRSSVRSAFGGGNCASWLPEHVEEPQASGQVGVLDLRVRMRGRRRAVVIDVPFAQRRERVAVLDPVDVMEVLLALELGRSDDPDPRVVDVEPVGALRDPQPVLARAGDHVVAGLGVVNAAEIDDVVGVRIKERKHEEVVAYARDMQDLRLAAEVEPRDRGERTRARRDDRLAVWVVQLAHAVELVDRPEAVTVRDVDAGHRQERLVGLKERQPVRVGREPQLVGLLVLGLRRSRRAGRRHQHGQCRNASGEQGSPSRDPHNHQTLPFFVAAWSARVTASTRTVIGAQASRP